MILKVFLLLLSIIPLTAVRHYLDLRAYELFMQHNQDQAKPVNLNNQMEVEEACQFFRKKEIKTFKEMLFFSAVPLLFPLCNISLSDLKNEPKHAPFCVMPVAIFAAFAIKKFRDTATYIFVVQKYEKELSKFFPNQRSITFCVQRAGDLVNASQTYNAPIYNGGHHWVGGNHHQ